MFNRLYGGGYKKGIDDALRLISFTALTIAEVAVILALGFDTFEEQMAQYRDSAQEANHNSYKRPQQRLEIYEQAF
jgi:hypothetical protein